MCVCRRCDNVNLMHSVYWLWASCSSFGLYANALISRSVFTSCGLCRFRFRFATCECVCVRVRICNMFARVYQHLHTQQQLRTHAIVESIFSSSTPSSLLCRFVAKTLNEHRTVRCGHLKIHSSIVAADTSKMLRVHSHFRTPKVPINNSRRILYITISI